jgi:hypothetical protein
MCFVFCVFGFWGWVFVLFVFGGVFSFLFCVCVCVCVSVCVCVCIYVCMYVRKSTVLYICHSRTPITLHKRSLLFRPNSKVQLSTNRLLTKIRQTEQHCMETSYIDFYRNRATELENTNKLLFTPKSKVLLSTNRFQRKSHQLQCIPRRHHTASLIEIGRGNYTIQAN